jgi:hypothetical protein
MHIQTARCEQSQRYCKRKEYPQPAKIRVNHLSLKGRLPTATGSAEILPLSRQQILPRISHVCLNGQLPEILDRILLKPDNTAHCHVVVTHLFGATELRAVVIRLEIWP